MVERIQQFFGTLFHRGEGEASDLRAAEEVVKKPSPEEKMKGIMGRLERVKASQKEMLCQLQSDGEESELKAIENPSERVANPEETMQIIIERLERVKASQKEHLLRRRMGLIISKFQAHRTQLRHEEGLAQAELFGVRANDYVRRLSLMEEGPEKDRLINELAELTPETVAKIMKESDSKQGLLVTKVDLD